MVVMEALDSAEGMAVLACRGERDGVLESYFMQGRAESCDAEQVVGGSHQIGVQLGAVEA